MFSFSASLFSQTEFYSQQFQVRTVPGTIAQDGDIGASLNQGLQKGLGVELDEQAVQPTAKGFDVGKVVDTVMDFVKGRIVAAKRDGASDEELKGMFDAAREGVQQGFSEARDQINALGKMNEPLGEKIDRAEGKIYQKVDKLENRLLEPQVQSRGESKPAEESVSNNNQAESAPIRRLSYLEAKQERSESFSFELTTQDGDTVTINAFANQSAEAERIRARGEEGALRYSSFEFNVSSGFDLEIQGSLDEGEQLAIADLLSQVDALSKEFYEGDLQTAFEMALEITSDPSEIAQFSLNLSQSQTTSVEYGRYRSVPGSYSQGLPRGLAEPLASFAGGIRDAFSNASQFAQPRQLLEGLFEQFERSRESRGLTSPLLDLLEQNRFPGRTEA